MGFDRIISNQPQYSLIWRVIEAEVVPLCQKEGVGQIVWSPLAQGVLTGKYLPGAVGPAGRTRGPRGPEGGEMSWLLRDEVLEPVQAYAELCREAGYTPASVALAWVLRNENVSSAIVGRQPARADRRERQGARRRARARLRRGDREGARAHHALRPRLHPQPGHPALTRAGPAQPGASKREVKRAHLQGRVGAVFLEDPGIAGVCDAPALVGQAVAVGVEGGAGDLEVGRRHDDPVLEVPGPLRRVSEVKVISG